MKHSKKSLFLGILCLLASTISTSLSAQNLRAPAYPIATHNPYFSIWSMGDVLNEAQTKHWTGQDHSLLGIAKIDGEYYRFLGEESKSYNNVLPTADDIDYNVQYTEKKPKKGWEKVGFNDSSWKTGQAPFTDNDEANTTWESDNLYFRRTFDINEADKEDLILKLRHDDDIVAYLNGEKIYEVSGWQHSYKYIPISKAISSKLNAKGNVLAIHIQNTAGGRWLDAGLVKEVIPENFGTVLKAKQLSVNLNATQTIYEFEAKGSIIKATFTSPLLMDDLEVYSRPVSYITVHVSTKDGKPKNAEVYLGVSSNLAVNNPSQEVIANLGTKDELQYLKVGTTEQPILETKGDDVRIDWGYAYVSPEKNSKQYLSNATSALAPFIGNQPVSKTNELVGKSLMLNTITDLGMVSGSGKEAVFLLGYNEVESINYFEQILRPWWTKTYYSFETLLEASVRDYSSLFNKCEAFDAKLYKDAEKAGGKKYADIAEVAYRQANAAHALVESPQGELLFMSKENHSNGSINTVDITYPSSPLFILYSTDLMKGMLNGIFFYSESGIWKKPFAAHDLGTYPIATGQTYGEDMPVEEAGNMIIVTAAISAKEGHAAYAKSHWKTLTIWAEYLKENGFDPANQLSTDDFSGHLARNANLSVKAIIALASYGKMAGMLGDEKTATEYTAIAKKMARDWMEISKDGDHYALAFEQPNTWSQKYNLAWDTILDLNVFPDEVRKTEVNYYLKKMNKYGLPLDNRANYTKSDWVFWSATLTDNQKDFDAFIDPMWKYANETESRVPISDWHDTNNARMMNFKARSVVGGYFLQLLKMELNK